MIIIVNGTFEEGCGVVIYNERTGGTYHKVVYKNSIELGGNLYYKSDFNENGEAIEKLYEENEEKIPSGLDELMTYNGVSWKDFI